MNSLGRKDKNQEKKSQVFTAETFGVVLMLFSALLLVCLISGDKIFSLPGAYVKAYLMGLLGYFAYPTLAWSFFMGVLLLSGKKTGLNKKRKAFITLLLVCAFLVFHTITTRNDAQLSFGEQIALVWKRGATVSTGGGVLFTLVACPVAKLLTTAGAYVLFAVVILISAYILTKSIMSDKEKDKRGASEKFESTYSKPQAVTVAIPNSIDGVKEYPIETQEEITAKQKLFVKNSGDFQFKTKKETLKDENSSGIKIQFVAGVGQAVYQEPKKEESKPKISNEFKEKLDYIKTPAKIDFTKSVFEPTTRKETEAKSVEITPSVSVSAPITESGKEEIPFIDHEDSVEARADSFMGNYVDVPDFASQNSPVVSDVEEYSLPDEWSLEDKQDALDSIEESFINEREIISEFTEEVVEEQVEEQPIVNEEIDHEVIEPEISTRARSIFEPEEEKPKIEIGFRGENSSRRASLSAFTQSIEEKPVVEEDSDKPYEFKDYVRPPLDLLETYIKPTDLPEENHAERQEIIKQTLADFRINAEPQSYVQGPSITRYEIMMPAGVSVKRVLNYSEDLQMRLAVKNGVRIEAPIPGKNLVGIEVANNYKVTVGLREVMEGMVGQKAKPYSLMFGIGKDVVGTIKSDDLAKGPHYLVAGTTGSGKSVCLNGIITSLIMRYGPQDLRFILIDPKRVEFKKYEHLPHLLVDEIINEPQKVLAALTWAYEETERRNILFENCEVPVKDLEAYNTLIAKDGKSRLARIVIFVDELSDLMARCKKELDEKICMIAQKARSAGIHLVLATQYPSTQVITMTMKANLPSRIGFKVASHIESGVILNETGAEKLLGNGDMLYKNSTQSNTERYQGAFISDREIHGVVSYIRENNECHYDVKLADRLEKAMKPKTESAPSGEISIDSDNSANNDLFVQALELAIASGTVSISQLQRRFQIGYARAGGIVDKMEQLGYVSGNEGARARQVLITREEFEEKYGPMAD